MSFSLRSKTFLVKLESFRILTALQRPFGHEKVKTCRKSAKIERDEFYFTEKEVSSFTRRKFDVEKVFPALQGPFRHEKCIFSKLQDSVRWPTITGTFAFCACRDIEET